MSETIGTAYVDIRPASDAKGAFVREVDQVVDPAARSTTSKMKKAVEDGLKSDAGQMGLAAGVGAAFGTVVGRGLSAGLKKAWTGATDIFRTGLGEVKDYQAGLAQLEAGIKSTGGAAGLTAGQMEKLAGNIQKYSGQTDDSIVKGESLLLTFTNLRDEVGKGNDVFTQATKLTADLAARFGGDASSSAIQLGKALNDPVQGITALTRLGISFTDQQKQQIKTLQTSGDVLGAQKIILSELNKEVGGSAKAYGDTLPGQLDKSKRAYEDLSQTLLATAAPALEAAAKGTAAAADAAGKLGPTVPILLGIGGGLLVATKAVKAYQEIQTVLFGGAEKKVAANVAVARSYDGVAAAATRAAEAETLANGGGLIPRGGGGGGPIIVPAGATPTGGGGFFGRLSRFFAPGAAVVGTAAGGGRIATGIGKIPGLPIIGPGGLLDKKPSITHGPDGLWHTEDGRKFRRDGNQLTEVIDAPSLSRSPAADAAVARLQAQLGTSSKALAAARFTLADPTKRAAEASVLGGTLDSPFATLADRHPDLVSAREAQRRADAAVRAAEVAVRNARGGSGGASAAQIAAAEATVASREAAIRRRGGDDTAERLGLQAAEQRLADLRGKGGVNTDKLRAAEERLRAARVDAAKAAKDTHKAEEGTALSVKAVLDRLGGQLKNAKSLRDDSKTLIKNGISRGVLEELDKLEKDAPGTLDKVAKSMTPALAKQLNSQYDALTKVQSEFLTAPLRAAVEQAKAEQDKILTDAAKRQAAIYAKALKDAGVDLTPKGAPTPTGPAGKPEAPDTSPPPDPTHGPPDPHEHGPGAVHVNVTGFNAQQIRTIAAQEVARAGRQAALAGGP